MALEKNIKLRHEIESDGVVFVEEKTTITDDGAVVGQNNQRKTILPGFDYSAEADATKAICGFVQTDEVVSAYAAAQAAAAPAAEEAPAEESE
jgi:hypothetical protein